MILNDYRRFWGTTVGMTVVLFFGLASWSNLLHAEGNEGPHGGDYVASEFINKGYEVYAALNRNAANSNILTSVQRGALAFAIARTPVTAVEIPLYDHNGFNVDALTVSDSSSPTGKIIQLNRARWDFLLVNAVAIHQLVFHEYLWVIGEDDTNYRISRLLRMPPATPPLDLSEPLVVNDQAGTGTYYFYYTDQAGNKGTYNYVASGGSFAFSQNPGRTARVHTTAGVITICYDRRLVHSIGVTSTAGVVSYCTF